MHKCRTKWTIKATGKVRYDRFVGSEPSVTPVDPAVVPSPCQLAFTLKNLLIFCNQHQNLTNRWNLNCWTLKVLILQSDRFLRGKGRADATPSMKALKDLWGCRCKCQPNSSSLALPQFENELCGLAAGQKSRGVSDVRSHERVSSHVSLQQHGAAEFGAGILQGFLKSPV